VQPLYTKIPSRKLGGIFTLHPNWAARHRHFSHKFDTLTLMSKKIEFTLIPVLKPFRNKEIFYAPYLALICIGIGLR